MAAYEFTLKEATESLFTYGIEGKSGDEYKEDFDKVFLNSREDSIELLDNWSGGGFSTEEIKDFLDSYSVYEVKPVLTEYAFVLPESKFTKVINFGLETGSELYEELSQIEGVIETDYNGHFGNKVYVKIDSTLDTRETKQKIAKAIYDFATTNI